MKEAFNGLVSALNDRGQAEIVAAFRATHRTLQQQFVKMVIIPILIHLADGYKAGQCDGRNMAAGRLATLLLKDLTDDDLYLPFI